VNAQCDFKVAGEAVDRARQLLTNPHLTALEQCQQELLRAHQALECVTKNPGISRPALQGLAASLAHTREMLDYADGFYTTWTRLRNVLTGGYVADGQPAGVSANGSLSVEG